MRFFSILAVLIFALTTDFAYADPYEDAVAAFKKGDFNTVIRLLHSLAEGGNSEAQHIIGNAYLWRQDYQETANWYRRSADQGDTKAQQDRANLYLVGEGVPRDYVEAYKWFDLAAANETEPTWQR